MSENHRTLPIAGMASLPKLNLDPILLPTCFLMKEYKNMFASRAFVLGLASCSALNLCRGTRGPAFLPLEFLKNIIIGY